jgi:hypothetical protein
MMGDEGGREWGVVGCFNTLDIADLDVSRT